jgi:hypothetical protein
MELKTPGEGGENKKKRGGKQVSISTATKKHKKDEIRKGKQSKEKKKGEKKKNQRR